MGKGSENDDARYQKLTQYLSTISYLFVMRLIMYAQSTPESEGPGADMSLS